MKCKITNKEINPFMSFGKMPIANGFLKKENFEKEFFFDMEVGFSEDISLFQLNDHPKPEKMFNENYPFYTGSSEYMKKHFKNFSSFVEEKYLSSKSKIIEIGSNDGTFLKNFSNKQHKVIGFEPSKNVADEAMVNNVPTINKFFNKDNIRNLNEYLGKTDLIIASNVICHIPDLNNLIETIDLLLTNNGTFIFEEPYLGSMFEKISYDQIYDEHIYMFSASSILKIFNRYDFELVDVLPQSTHGGSMRYIIKRKNKSNISNGLRSVISYELKNRLDKLDACIEFKKNCEISKKNIKDKIIKLKDQKKTISGYAATSKSTTILNYCDINKNYIDYICDTTKEKIGRFSPGMHIPIVNMKHFYENKTDCIYLFAWNHKEEILNKEKNFQGEWFSHVTL